MSTIPEHIEHRYMIYRPEKNSENIAESWN